MAVNHQDNPPTKRSIPWGRLILATVLILIVLPCLGLAGSVVYVRARRAGVLAHWQSLGTPPEGGLELVTGDISVVYVRTATGNLYGCGHSDRRGIDECWYEAQEPLNVDPEARYDARLYQGDVESPPGEVVDTLEVTVWYAEDAFETRYVLLEDSTVWKWEYDVGAYTSLFTLMLGPLVGLVIGVLVVVIFWVGAGLRSLQPRTK